MPRCCLCERPGNLRVCLACYQTTENRLVEMSRELSSLIDAKNAIVRECHELHAEVQRLRHGLVAKPVKE